jgi:hypothetical protein
MNLNVSDAPEGGQRTAVACRALTVNRSWTPSRTVFGREHLTELGVRMNRQPARCLAALPTAGLFWQGGSGSGQTAASHGE